MATKRGRKILVAVDQSLESSHALSWCLNNLICRGRSLIEDTLILLFVKSPLSLYPSSDSTAVAAAAYPLSTSIIAATERYASEIGETVMEKAKILCKDKVAVETMVEHGDPRDVICEVADRLKVDFLVMGSHGYGLIQRAFLGSVSNYCVHNANCPVLIIKMPK